MRLLVVTPLYHMYPAALESILALDKPCRVDYLMLAADDPFADGTLMGGYRNITHKLNRAREVALRGGHDAMVLLEDDMIVPPDTLTRLLACESDIAYGLTCWRNGKPGWSARMTLTEGGDVVNLSDYPDEARRLAGQVVDVAGVGTFCTLIRRRVFTALPFRLSETLPVCCDWWTSVDAQRLGFSQRADLGLVCGHITPTPTPRVIWPDAREERLWRIQKL